MAKGQLLVLTGFSASGNDTLMQKDLEVYRKYSFDNVIYNEERKLEEAFRELLKIIEG